ncbi:uncharacterized protein [Onthophagus taurus]|uniref:uncharacterized protein isoform X1 n=1 Tax=Onthophagus taurus TaxID=166361 RepID=UPI0039BEA5E3
MPINVYEGEISSIDEDLLSFQIKGESNIFYAAKWVLANKTFFTPNYKITIKICHDTEEKYPILCDECQIEFPIITQKYNNDLLDLIIKYNLDDDYMKEVYKQHRNLFNEYFDVRDGNIILQVLKETLIINNNRFNLKPISACKIVDNTNIKYQSFPLWTYTFHKEHFDNQKNLNNYIIGFLKINNMFGVPMLVDSQWNVPVFIFKNNEIKKYINHFVLIKETLLIAEIFNVPNQETISCVILNSDDIIPLILISNVASDNVNDFEVVSNRIIVNLSHIGPVLKGQTDQEECWIEAHNNKLGKIFIILSNELLKVRPLLSINCEYDVVHKYPLQPYKWREINRLYNLNGFIFKKSTTKFVFKSFSNLSQQLLNVQEAITYVREKTDDVNITGLIAQKLFKNLAKSFYGGKRYQLPFGTPGDSTQVIVLKQNEASVRIFLNDFNRYLYPFGLISGMVVNIYRVRPQSKTYFKCTPLTTFEFVEFNTPSIIPANLHSLYKNFQEVKQMHYVSNVEDELLFPFDIVFLFQLKSVSVDQGLIVYDEEKQKMKVDILLNCSGHGCYQLQVKSESVLKSLLCANKVSYEIFCKAIKEIKYFKYCEDDAIKNDIEDTDEVNIFKHSLNLAMYMWRLRNYEIEVYVRRTLNTSSTAFYTTVDF